MLKDSLELPFTHAALFLTYKTPNISFWYTNLGLNWQLASHFDANLAIESKYAAHITISDEEVKTDRGGGN